MTLRTATGDEDLAAAMAIRRAVFVQEQEIPPEEEFDARDAEAEHLLIVDDDGTPVATCRVFADDDGDGTARLGRLAVLPRARRRGLASRMIAACEVAPAPPARPGWSSTRRSPRCRSTSDPAIPERVTTSTTAAGSCTGPW